MPLDQVYTLTLWESDIGKLQEQENYQLIKLIVCWIYKASITCPSHCLELLYTTLTTCKMFLRPLPLNSPWMRPSIVLKWLECHPSRPTFVASSAKVNDDDEELGKCTKCNMSQLVGSYTTQISAKLYIQSDVTYYTFQVFGEMLKWNNK